MDKVLQLNKNIQLCSEIQEVYHLKLGHYSFWLNNKGYIDNKERVLTVSILESAFSTNSDNKDINIKYKYTYLDNPLEGIDDDICNYSDKIPFIELYQLIDDEYYNHLSQLIIKEFDINESVIIQLICYSLILNQEIGFMKMAQYSDSIKLIKKLLIIKDSSLINSMVEIYKISHLKIVANVINEVKLHHNQKDIMSDIQSNVLEKEKIAILSYLL